VLSLELGEAGTGESSGDRQDTLGRVEHVYLVRRMPAQ